MSSGYATSTPFSHGRARFQKYIDTMTVKPKWSDGNAATSLVLAAPFFQRRSAKLRWR